MTAAPSRALVFVAATEGADERGEALARVPAGLLADPGVGRLVLDEGRTDEASRRARAGAADRGRIPVGRDATPQGLGASRKLGLRLGVAASPRERAQAADASPAAARVRDGS